MNFEKDLPADALIGQLLAFIVMFEKKLEQIKCKLAGNQQFHTRVAFQTLDVHRKNQLSAQVLAGLMHNTFHSQADQASQLFLRRHSTSGALTYDEFLKVVTPKSSKTLAQRMLIRNYPKGAILEEYLQRHLNDLLALYFKMATVTETLRNRLAQAEQLTQLELVEFFQQRINSGDSLTYFLQRSMPNGEQYQIEPEDAVFLSYHVQSGNELEDFTDVDVKELLCPLDLNPFQKHYTKQTFYQATGFAPSQPQTTTKYSTQPANFLGKTYQRLYERTPRAEVIKKEPRIEPGMQVDRYTVKASTNRVSGHNQGDQSYNNLFINNFTSNETSSRLQLNQFIGGNSRGHYEQFQDDLRSNGSSYSQGSAFDRS